MAIPKEQARLQALNIFDVNQALQAALQHVQDGDIKAAGALTDKLTGNEMNTALDQLEKLHDLVIRYRVNPPPKPPREWPFLNRIAPRQVPTRRLP